MKKLLFAALALVGLFAVPANAQQASSALILAVCGSAAGYVAGTYGILTMDPTGKLCDGGGGGGGGSVTQGTSPWVDNITQWASTILGAATAWGTAPTGNVPGVNANILGPVGQQLSAASIPVVLPAVQIATLTPPAAITGFATQTTLAAVLAAQGAAPAQQTGAVVGQVSQYPNTAVPITGSVTGTTAATTATLTNVSGHTTYICGFSIRANATAAVTNNATVTGTVTGTLNFSQWTAPLATGIGVTEEIFSPCIPASAVSTSIAVVSGAPGSGGVVSVTAWGYSI